MNARANMKGLLTMAVVALAACALVLAYPADAFAQCALCRSAVEQGGSETAKAMNLGILVLLVPPVAIFCTIFAVAVKHGKGDGGEDQQD